MPTLNWNTLDGWERLHVSGLYRHMITTSFGYEIHVVNWLNSTQIINANAVLIVATDRSVNNATLFTRSSIYAGSVRDCIRYAIEDCNERLLGLEEISNEKNNN